MTPPSKWITNHAEISKGLRMYLWQTPNKPHFNSWRRLILSAQSPLSIYTSAISSIETIKRNRDTIEQNSYLAIKDPSIILKTHQYLGPCFRQQ